MIQLERGEVCASERYLATRWKWSTSKVRAYLTLLEADRMIGKQKKQGVTVIRLCNYERYNPERSDEKARINQEESSDEAGSKQIEEEKEGKEGEGLRPPAKGPRRPTLKEALGAASEIGVTPSVAQCWWETREASDWIRSTATGNTPVGANWRADMKMSVSWVLERLAKTAQATAETTKPTKPTRCT